MTAQTLSRPNAYPANCIRCSGRIAAGQGLLARTADGKWAADHPADCPPKPTVIAQPPTVQRVTQDGIYRDPADGVIYKVQIAKQGSGNLYAKRLHVTPTEDGWKGTFRYAAGAIHTLRAEWRLSLDDARAFGALYGVCVACGADLTDEKSIANGIGPICGAKYF